MSNPQRGAEKTAKIPIKIIPTEQTLRKPEWIRIKVPAGGAVTHLKSTLRQHGLHTVCEEASCPNLNECFSGGTATFMIMGEVCTRRCPFCDVAHGRPDPLDPQEPENLSHAVVGMKLKYVVITSVDRDDLRDGGAGHFVACIQAVRQASPQTKIEVLVPDFRGRMELALDSLYKQARPGADYAWSLQLLQKFKQQHPEIPTKSGIMVGLGEEISEVEQVMADLRAHGCNMLTIGQYLQPSKHHLPVQRYVTPEEFVSLAESRRWCGHRIMRNSKPLVKIQQERKSCD